MRWLILHELGLGGSEDINVQIAPTSKGLRDGLTGEGIEFSMPLSLKRRSASSSTAATTTTAAAASINGAPPCSMAPAIDGSVGASSSAEDDVEEEEDLASTAASNWLESMGIDKSKFPTLNPHRVSLAQDNFKIVDGRPESLVTIQGGNALGGREQKARVEWGNMGQWGKMGHFTTLLL